MNIKHWVKSSNQVLEGEERPKRDCHSDNQGKTADGRGLAVGTGKTGQWDKSTLGSKNRG